MQKVILSMSMSVDGVVGAADNSEWMQIHEQAVGWLFATASWRASQGMSGGEDGIDSKIWQNEFDRVGAQVIGRTMFDNGVEPWGSTPPQRCPVVVVTHRPHPQIDKLGGTYFTFLPDLKSAIDNAKQAANGKDVLIAGGATIGQTAIREKLCDEIVLHVNPTLVGRGLKLFDTIGDEFIDLNCERVEKGEHAVHMWYQLNAVK